MTEFLYEDRKTYFSGTKGPSAKNEVFIGGGVFCFWLVINSLWRRLLNSQMPNRSGILTILSNSSRLSLMISLRYRWTRRRDTNDYGSAFLDVIFLSLTLLVEMPFTMIYYLALTLKNSTFPFSEFLRFLQTLILRHFLWPYHLKIHRPFFSLHYCWLFDLFEYNSRELGCRFSVELTLWNFLGVAI